MGGQGRQGGQLTTNYQLPTTRSRFTSRLRRENATATLGQTPRPQWLPYQGRPFTNHQPLRASPVAWVGKTPLRPLARPQDRSGSPTFGREVSRGESSRLQTQAPLHHQPQRGDARFSLPRSAPPVAWVGKTPLRPLARPQDRSGSPTFGREVSRRESSRLQTQAPLHHQPPTTNY
ncbi:MAG: hypothetical protein ACHBN1_21405 [Heteroscytonema crispum UTEX LB 1556]